MENGDQHRLKINARGNLEINAKLTAGIFIEYNLTKVYNSPYDMPISFRLYGM